jgi:hypothetical protein
MGASSATSALLYAGLALFLFASPFPIVADQYQNTRTHTFYVEVQAQD